MVVFEMYNAKKYCLGSRGAPQTPIPLYSVGEQRFFLDAWVVVSEMHNAKKKMGCGVAPHTPIPLYSIGQQKCF